MSRYLKVFFVAALFLSLAKSPVFTAADNFLNVAVKKLGGEEATLSNLSNKRPMMLLFWTTWCPFCRKQLMELNKSHEVIIKEGMDIWVINVGETEALVSSFIERQGIKINVLLDEKTELAQSLEILGVPTYIILDADKNIAYRENYLEKDGYKQFLKK